MANVPGTFYTAETQRRGTTPVSPPSAVDDPQDPVNPGGPPVVPPVAERYASEAAMIADQLNQKSGYLYFDGTDTWWYLGTTTGTIADYESFGGGGVQSVTGDGVDNTDPDNPVLSFPTTAEIGAQDDLGTDINAALVGANVPSVSNVFATMADLGGGGADANAVHYNAADGKTASEKQRARTNIGLNTGEPDIVTTDANINNYARTSNLIVFEGATAIRQLTGVLAAEDGESFTLWNRRSFDIIVKNEVTSTFANRFSIGADLTLPPNYRVTFVYDSLIDRWVYESSSYGIFLRKDIADSRSGTLTQNGAIITTGSITQNISGGETFLISRSGTGGSGAVFGYQNLAVPARGFSVGVRGNITVNSDGVSSIFDVAINQTVRSSGATTLIRRDEKRLYDVVTVTTSGAINNQALTAAVFNYRFTAATHITGFVATDIGTTIDIDNATGATLTIQNENAGSTAANRNKLIGAADIVMPIDGKMTIKYCTGSRWELVSKNF